MIQAIEFESQSHDGVIKIPEQYQDWFQKTIKVILLANDFSEQNQNATNWNTKLSSDIYGKNVPHITRHPNICSGEPIIQGTRTTVRTVVNYHKMGLSEAEILRELPHLNSAEFHAALSYYFDNQAEIEGYIAKNNDYTVWQQYLEESECTQNSWMVSNDNQIVT